jgi:signal transduction histidine kinase
MKRVALVFVIAVLLPSLVLAWLAVRSLRDQQFLLERQQSLLCQRMTDALAQNISDHLAQRQQEFGGQVEALVGGQDARSVGSQFDAQIRQHWPLAEVGFCVTRSGKILSPGATARDEAKIFYSDNNAFLGNRESAEVYGNVNTPANNAAEYAGGSSGGSWGRRGFGFNNSGANQKQMSQSLALANPAAPAAAKAKTQLDVAAKKANSAGLDQLGHRVPDAQVNQQLALNSFNSKAQTRKVTPQSENFQSTKDETDEEQKNLSRVIPAEGEFSQLIGEGTDGMLARFLQNKLKLMFWHRPSREPDLIFGAQLNMNRVIDGLRGLVQADPELQDEICVALLDDNAKPVVISREKFQANWKRPFVATEIGDALPHWEIAAYLVNPAKLTQAAHTTKLTLGLLIAVLLLAIGVGSWLIVRSLSLELRLARQKTDFVSNVSHELKTPLTSIRMFSELLAEGRVTDATKQRSYLNIITAEAARLTRLINNVLDFSRMESGEKKYNFQPCDLAEVVRATAETFRPHLEAGGFKFDYDLPVAAISVRGDADALSQVIVNLLSNAEKYSNGGKEIELEFTQQQSPLPHAEIKVLDRGAGVPRGSEAKVFEKFYRAHDSLGSGIQGSGLGLTIARQIARAHGGDVVYEAREGGGSCFVLRLPISTTDGHG